MSAFAAPPQRALRTDFNVEPVLFNFKDVKEKARAFGKSAAKKARAFGNSAAEKARALKDSTQQKFGELKEVVNAARQAAKDKRTEQTEQNSSE